MGTKILAVDDDEATSETMQMLLESLGYVTLTVPPSNAEVALEQFEPDAVLLHLGHPNNPWLHLVAKLRASREDLPVVGLTAWNLEAFQQDAAEVGLTALLAKPVVDITRLLKALPPLS